MADKDISYWKVRVREAYTRFKAYVYYDNFNLLLRAKLATYEKEAGSPLEDKLDTLAVDLFNYIGGAHLNERLSKMIDEIDYKLVPKKFEKKSSSTEILFSNKVEDVFKVRKSTYLFDGAIELHLIATLWIIEEAGKLYRLSGRDSYGYHLKVNAETGELVTDKLLFSKYFDKYQEWRDKGIKAATSQIEEGNDVLLMSLDIKDFFHSVDIDFDKLKSDLGIRTDNSITDLIAKVCASYALKVKVKTQILPIGLVSSGVIANWLLAPFDREIKDKLGPVYYGRYVDDIFIVLSNVQLPPHLLLPAEKEVQEASDSKILDWLISRFFYNGPLKKLKDEQEKDVFAFTEDRYDTLVIQGKKLKLFYFSPDWPQAMLNKFQKTLKENSSAFWFLPEEEELKDSFDDDAFDLHYEDTINKFRSISNVKASKYGASVFLAKRIKLAILNDGTSEENINKQIFRFFNGLTILELYNLWEKVLTYFVVVNDKKSLNKFITKAIKAINSISSDFGSDKIKESLLSHLQASSAMAISLNPGLIADLKAFNKLEYIDFKRFEDLSFALRYSLLLRHHYLPLPILILTDYLIEGKETLLSQKLVYDLLKSHDQLRVNNSVLASNWRIPRWIYLQEICMLSIINLLAGWDKESPIFNKNNRESLEFEDCLVEESLELFKRVNNKSLDEEVKHGKYKAYRTGKENENVLKIFSSELFFPRTIELKKLRIGLTNAKLDPKDLHDAIKIRSNVGDKKRAKHIRLINEAERQRIDLLLLPETSVPLNWLYAYSDEARRKNRAFIFGLEHFTIDNMCLNLSICLLPFNYGKIQDVLIVPRLKNHYSPSEISSIEKWGKDVPRIRPHIYHLYKWRGLQFTLYNCYELTDVVQRSIFRSEIDILFAIEYNKDVNYFSNIAESTSRDLHCFYVQANTSQYGDTRVVVPKETALMNPVRVKGGENDVILTTDLMVEELRSFQSQYPPYQWADKSYKATPPDFDHTAPKRRGKPSTPPPKV